MNAMVALERCRRAWERTSPQLVIDGWLDMLDALDEPQGMAECRRSLRFVEPVRPPHSPAGGLESRLAAGATSENEPLVETRAVVSPVLYHTVAPAASRVLNPGAEPCCGTPDGLTASPAAADTATPVPSAPFHYYGPGRDLFGESHGRGQIGA